MGRHTTIALRLAIITLLIFGVIYPLFMTGLSQLLFAKKANGSLIKQHGQIVGSELIGQSFKNPSYFQSRLSAAGNGYDATSSGGSNLGPTNKEFAHNIENRVDDELKQNPNLVKGRIPVDMVTASGSGLDPDISPANAYAQIPRIAKTRGISETRIRNLVDQNTTGRTFGILGEPRVNVLKINMELDKLGKNHND